MIRPVRLLLILFLALALPAMAAPEGAAFDLDDGRKALVAAQRELAAAAGQEAVLLSVRERVMALSAQADELAAARAQELATIEARRAELGEAPAAGSPEPPEIAAERKALEQQHARLDSEVRRARLLAVEARQVASQVVDIRRSRFQAQLLQRTRSPLSPRFWRDFADRAGQSWPRLRQLAGGLAHDVATAVRAPGRLPILGGILAGAVLMAVGWTRGARQLLRAVARRLPRGRLRRSGFAVASIATTTLAAGGGAELMFAALDRSHLFTGESRLLARSLVAAVWSGTLVVALGRALVAADRPSWRLLPLPDAGAQALRPFPLAFGFAVAFGLLERQLSALVGAGLPLTITGGMLAAFLYSALLLLGLARLRRALREGGAASPRPAWATLAALLGLAALLSLLALLTGYVALGQQLARQAMDLLVLGGVLYLLVRAAEDLLDTLCRHGGVAGRELGVGPRVLEQVAVLVSGVLRVLAVLALLGAALAPMSSGPADLAAQLGHAGRGLSIGELQLEPRALATAAAVLVLGMLAVRVFKRWLLGRFLPTTRLDQGMRISLATLAGYAGGVVVIAFTLSALGLGLERVTWIASALSVGIGFGLQAIVQNFVSGLILLVERPVKVGDWVILGDIEGDIRRINVRATEIRLRDRSTAIVPNSELITKSVRNVTLDHAQGRVQLRLPMPLDSDVEHVRDALLGVVAAHPDILATPAPTVLLDGIADGNVLFVGTGYVADPRQAGRVRSELLAAVLVQLRGAAGRPLPPGATGIA